MINPVYQNKSLIVFRCEDLMYPEYSGRYFCLEKSEGYGYFYGMTKTWTRGEILDKFNITLP